MWPSLPSLCSSRTTILVKPSPSPTPSSSPDLFVHSVLVGDGQLEYVAIDGQRNVMLVALSNERHIVRVVEAEKKNDKGSGC